MTTQQVIDFLKNNYRGIIAVLVVGAPILSGILKELRQRAKTKNAQLALERRRIEDMRLGRSAESQPTGSNMEASRNTAANQLEEMARRRREQSENVRGQREQDRQQAAGSRVQQAPPTVQRQGVPTQAMPVPPTSPQRQPQRQTPVQAQGRPQPQNQQRRPVQMQRPVQPQRQTTQQAPQRPQKPQRQQQRPVQPPSVQPRPAQRGPQTASESVQIAMRSSEAHDRLHDAQELTHRLVADVANHPDSKRSGMHLPRNEWKRALVLREVLSTPLSLRDDGEDTSR